jgi:hypothetical protein
MEPVRTVVAPAAALLTSVVVSVLVKFGVRRSVRTLLLLVVSAVVRTLVVAANASVLAKIKSFSIRK